MSKDIKIYLLIVVLPAILLVAGGMRLISLESERALALMRESLQDRANATARKIAFDIKFACADDFMKSPAPPRKKFHPQSHGRHGCMRHDIPDDIAKIFGEALQSECENEEFKIALQIRHQCGCVLLGTEPRKPSSILAKTPIKPFLGDWYVVALPLDGDDALALGIRSKVVFTTILILLLLSTLTAGCTLLIRAERRAREEARRKTDFISNISHELKTPLTSITLFAEMLSSGALNNEATAKASATILKESKRLGSLIESLLDYARLEKNTIQYSIGDFKVSGLLEEIAQAFGPAFPKGLRVEIKDDDLSIRADREKTRRILDCLLENAAKYAADFGETTISAKRRGDKIAISVADLGNGISKSDAGHIFERFWRADNSITRTTGGTGLGLAIAKELALGMNGELSLGENAPRGAVFTLSLDSSPE